MRKHDDMDIENVLVVEDLKKWFPVRAGLLDFFRRMRGYVRAVDGISFSIEEGEIFGLIGETGSGKTTTARLITRLIEPTEGRIEFKGTNILKLTPEEVRNIRKRIQMIFQDPYSALDPRQTVYNVISEPLRVYGTGGDLEDVVSENLEKVRLTPPESYMLKFPHELSGGERQRVVVARSLALDPEFIIADEPVSMVDVSIRAGILNLMLDLKEKHGLTYLMITHDITMARYMCNRIAVMYLGKIVEIRDKQDVVNNPFHPYTQLLISSVIEPKAVSENIEQDITLKYIYEPPNPINPPAGCRFHPRCPHVMDRCRREEPILTEVEGGGKVACQLYAK